MTGDQRETREIQTMKTQINQKLIETGEKEKLKQMLRNRLVESGWRESLMMKCREIVKKKGIENITVDELVNEITPIGRSTVQDTIKMELLQEIRKFLDEHSRSP